MASADEIEIEASHYFTEAQALTDNQDLQLAIAWRAAYADLNGDLLATREDLTDAEALQASQAKTYRRNMALGITLAAVIGLAVGIAGGVAICLNLGH